MDLSLLTLLPSTSIDAPVEAKLASVPIAALPDFTKLSDERIEDEQEREGSILLDGCKSSTPHTTECALRNLRLPDKPRYILSERFQNGAEQRAWLQFDLDKAPAYHAFWRYVWNCDDLEEDYDVMDLFVIVPNRYTETAEYFTKLDRSPESDEIRLLVLPPSGGQTSSPLHCEFRNVRLNDSSKPEYQTFVVSGPAEPRNGHAPVYKYDITINGHLCVSSNGIRTGLQQIQHEFEEQLVWNEELCFNCRDVIDSRHFQRLRSDIIKGATSGAILMYDRVSSFTTTMNSNRNFKHPALNRKTREIRLLEFSGDSKDEAVTCKLVVRNLDEMPVFKALSYVWGDDTGYAMHYTQYQTSDDITKWPLIQNPTSKTVFLKSFEELAEQITVNKVPLITTKHLATALRCLRDRGKCRYFWVDALCIDQSSWEDRSSQVCMMSEIYAQAEQVIAWLGVGNKEDATVEILNMLGAESFDIVQFVHWGESKGAKEEEEENLLTRMEASGSKPPENVLWKDVVQGFPTLESEDTAEDSVHRTIFSCLRDRAFIKSVEALVSHPWWHRLWIYQESVIPVSLILHRGTYSITFETLWNAYDAIRRLSNFIPFYSSFPRPMLGPLSLDSKKYGMLASIRQERQRRHNAGFYPASAISNDWLFYIEELARREASDPRDVIYAAIGLATLAPRKIVPDYSKDIAEVYTNAAKETIKDSNDLMILSMCGGVIDTSAVWASHLLSKDLDVKRKAAPLPSWVPYWGEQNRSGMGAKSLQSHRLDAPAFCAGGTKGAGAKFSKDSRILFATGVVVDVMGKIIKGYEGKRKGGGKQVTYDGKNFVLSKVAYNNDLVCAAWFKAFSLWQNTINSLLPQSNSYITGGSKKDALKHALYAPFYKAYLSNAVENEESLETDLAEFKKRYDEEARKWEAEQEKSFSTFTSQSQLDKELTDLAGTLTISTRHELLVTELGYIGVSPPGCSQVGGVQVGDLLVVLRGGGVPFILRRVGDLERYLLVGDAYVHGLMYGTALEGVKESELKKFPII